MAVALPDFAHVLLLRGVSRESLLHTGTGELVALDGFGHCLCRSERGFAILRRDGKPDSFTFDVFAF